MPINPVTIKRMFSTTQSPALHSMLNLWAFDEGALVGVDMQMTYVYEATCPDLSTKIDPDRESFFAGIKNVLHSLSDGVALQFLVRSQAGAGRLVENYRDIICPKDNIGRLIVDKKIEHLNEVFLKHLSVYVFVTVFPDAGSMPKIDSAPFTLFAKNKTSISELRKVGLAKLAEAASAVSNGFADAGIKIHRLDEASIARFLYEYLNPSRQGILDIAGVSSDRTLRSQICFNACENNFDSVYLDGFYYRAVNLLMRPTEISFNGFLEMLPDIQPDADISFCVYSGEQSAYLKHLNITSTTAKSIQQFNPLKRNHEAEAQAHEADSLVEDVKTSFQKLYGFTMSVILRDRTLEQLTLKTNEALNGFRKFGEADGIIDDMNHLALFLSAMPGHSHLNSRRHLFHTDAIAQMMPLSAKWKGCPAAKMLFQTNDQRLLPLNLFDDMLDAKHGFIMGTSGSGKSFTANYLLTNFLVESPDNHVVIVEPGGSYRKICSMFGGQYLEVELSDKYSFNPFPLKEDAVIKNSTDEFEIDPDVISYLTALLRKMLKMPVITNRQETIIQTAVTNTFKYSKMDPPILSALLYQLEHYSVGDAKDKSDALDFAKNLELWVTGSYGKLFNRPTSIRADHRIVVFDLQKLERQPELQSIIFFLISTVVGSKLRNLGLRKMIVFDEGWKFFDDPVGTVMIQDLYRTARKRNAGILTISQSPVEFLKSQASTAIISNSMVKYILRMKADMEMLSSFGLNEREVEEVAHLERKKGEFSDVFLKFGEHNRVLRIAPTKVDYWICTTDPDDLKTEQRFRAEHPDYTEAQIIEGLAGEPPTEKTNKTVLEH